MIEEKKIPNGAGIRVSLPNANLILLVGKKGFVMCGYLNLETAEKVGDAAAVVTGVSTIEDALTASVKKVTSKARQLGVREKMTGEEALKCFS
jgi:uncharacterized protein YunC (DUF1805 family)